jgi:hypothetical protein
MRSEIVHDWSPYNRWVDRVSDRVGVEGSAPARPRFLFDWWIIAKAIALCLLAVGIAVALILWAWRDPKIVVPEIKVQLEQPKSTVPPRPSVERPTRESTDTSKLIRNYVLFSEQALPGIGVAVTGWKFDSENNPRPVEQWCYLEPLHGSEAGALTRISLPRFSAASTSQAALRRHQLTPAKVEKARRACVWFEG